MKKIMVKMIGSRVRFSIWLVLGIAVCITLSGLFHTRPKAQDISPQTTGEKPQPSDELDRSLSALAAIAICDSAPITVGQTINGNLQSGDCVYPDNTYYDAYTFNGAAGQQIAISMNSSQFNAFLFLYQGNYPGGTSVASDDNGGGGTNARIPAGSGFFTLPATGTYTILANSYAVGGTGAYSLSLTGTCPPPQPITVGQTVNGTLQGGDCVFTRGSYYDAYTFNGSFGQRIAISMNSSQFDAYLYLVQGDYPGGTIIASNDDGGGGTNARIPAGSGFFTLPATGTYTILANSYVAGETGAYSLSLSGDCPPPIPMTVGETVNGTLQSDDCVEGDFRLTDRYSFNGTAGQQIAIAMNSSEVNALLVLYDGTFYITEDDNGGGGTNARIPAGSGFFTLPATATYTIKAKSFTEGQTGAYSLSLFGPVVSTCSPTPITVGQNLNGNLQNGDCVYMDGSYYDAYTFSGTAGQQIAISMNSSQFNAYLLLVQGVYPGGSIIATNDNGGGGTNARIPAASGYLTLLATGTFTILANSSIAGQSGAYSLSLSGNVLSARRPFDFDGDTRTDLSIFRPGPGEWWVNRSSNGSTFAAQFGASTDRIVPADYTGDARTDIAVWRASNGNWIVLRSEDFSFFAFPYGTSGDIPAPGDFDADGLADTAVFRPSTSTWYIRRSSDGGSTIQQFGIAGDVPVTADYDGDGRADIAIYRPSLGEWWIVRSTAGTVAYQFGNSGDRTVQGDYTGDGKADIAFWRPSTGTWYVLRSENTTFFGFPYGTSTDIPSPGDYDGDGKYDGAVFRPSTATWYVNRSSNGTSLIQQFGATGDLSVPNSYVR